MGLIHSRASKKRDKAAAELLAEQTRQLKAARKDAEHDEAVERAGGSVWRQPTVRDAFAAARRKKSQDG